MGSFLLTTTILGLSLQHVLRIPEVFSNIKSLEIPEDGANMQLSVYGWPESFSETKIGSRDVIEEQARFMQKPALAFGKSKCSDF